MKKVLILIGLLLLISTQAFAAGTCTESKYYESSDNGIVAIKVACTADSGDASFPNETININGYILKVETDPGATGPTDDALDIVLNAAGSSVDVMGGELLNRDETDSEVAMPKNGNGYGATYVDKVTMVMTNNLVNSAVVDVYIWISTNVPVSYY